MIVQFTKHRRCVVQQPDWLVASHMDSISQESVQHTWPMKLSKITNPYRPTSFKRACLPLGNKRLVTRTVNTLTIMVKGTGC